ncbi:DUF4440 domain-containing protein [Pseudomonas sp. MC042]|uniref:DUF4440 domain-containing protein n=1 Tax=Pseudomonas piscis TaxID=2614538 RepID=A0A7X1PIQ4_9PSED|nr:DUF4440 domain-containing protein [Pseudomonas piscis]MQA52929.1 DUF4440 domain-containing protein [Pseudomonas piscis]
MSHWHYVLDAAAGWLAAPTADAGLRHHRPQPSLPRDAEPASQGRRRTRDGFVVRTRSANNVGAGLQADAGGLIHDVATMSRMQGERHFSQERATLGLRQQQEGLWLACHDFLSAMPERLPPP